MGGPGRAAWVARPGLREPQVLRGLGRATPSRTRLGARATQAARLARPEVRCGLGGFDFFWVFSSSSFFFLFFPSGSDFIFAVVVVLLYIGL